MTRTKRAPLPGPIGRVCAHFYAWEVARRNRGYDAGRGVVTLDRPVISVGNLSVGGTGKTPVVMHLVRCLRDDSFRPCVAMRGYTPRRGSGGSDEASLYRAAFPDLPLAVGADRVSALIDLFAGEAGRDVDCVVLDDGFQHRRIARQLDLVLLDATRDPFQDRCLPAGWLREPVSGLSRAHAVIVTHAESADDGAVSSIMTRARALLPARSPVCVASHEWTGLRVRGATSVDAAHPITWLSGMRVLACCAIGNPHPFLRAISDATGRDCAGQIVLRDHDPYEAPTVSRVLDAARRARADAIVMTEKDWVKLARVRADKWPCPVVRPVLSVRITRGEAELRDRLRACARGMVVD